MAGLGKVGQDRAGWGRVEDNVKHCSTQAPSKSASNVARPYRELDVVSPLSSAVVVHSLVGVTLLSCHDAFVHQPLQPNVLHHTLALTHSLKHSLSRSFSHSVSRSFSHSFSQSFTHSLTRSLTRSVSQSFIYSFIHSSIHPSTHPSINHDHLTNVLGFIFIFWFILLLSSPHHQSGIFISFVCPG